jgi:hypothetical protein
LRDFQEISPVRLESKVYTINAGDISKGQFGDLDGVFLRRKWEEGGKLASGVEAELIHILTRLVLTKFSIFLLTK